MFLGRDVAAAQERNVHGLEIAGRLRTGAPRQYPLGWTGRPSRRRGSRCRSAQWHSEVTAALLIPGQQVAMHPGSVEARRMQSPARGIGRRQAHEKVRMRLGSNPGLTPPRLHMVRASSRRRPAEPARRPLRRLPADCAGGGVRPGTAAALLQRLVQIVDGDLQGRSQTENDAGENRDARVKASTQPSTPMFSMRADRPDCRQHRLRPQRAMASPAMPPASPSTNSQ